jgi:hypothetical protein
MIPAIALLFFQHRLLAGGLSVGGPFAPPSGLFETLPDSCSRVVTPFLRMWRSTLFIEMQSRLQDTVVAGGYIYVRSPIDRVVWKVQACPVLLRT